MLTRAEFLDLLNAWGKLRGFDPVTDRVLSRWNEESVFPAARPVGHGKKAPPEWLFEFKHCRRGVLLCHFIKSGMVRYSAIRNELWLRDLILAPDTLRADLLNEWHRFKASLLRPINSTFLPGNPDPTGRLENTLRRQMGPLSPIFDFPLAEIPISSLLSGFFGMRIGEVRSGFPELVESKVSTILAREKFKPAIAKIANPQIFAGILTDEKDLIQVTIEAASDRKLKTARDLMRQITRSILSDKHLLKVARCTGFVREEAELEKFREASKAVFSNPKWRFAVFLFVLLFVQQATEIPPESAENPT